MKKFGIAAITVISAAAFATGCGSSSQSSTSAADTQAAQTESTEESKEEETEKSADNVKVSIGVVGSVYDELWAGPKAKLADEGVDLDIVQFSDYVTPNNALNSGEIDLNAFQHQIYLNNEIEQYGSAQSELIVPAPGFGGAGVLGQEQEQFFADQHGVRIGARAGR